MNLKGFGRKRSWSNFKVSAIPTFCGGTEENHETLNQDAGLLAEI
jgi:hypothetical protein